MNAVSEKQTRDFEAHLREQKVPRYLYKYRGWHCGNDSCTLTKLCRTCKRNRLILTDQAIWFASPESFNDPFDCKIPLRHDLMSKDARFEYVKRLASEMNPGWTDENVHSEAERLVRTSGVFSEDSETRRAAIKERWRLISDSYGVLSFAGGLRSILLWSHYADSHRGYCIKVDAHQTAKELFALLLSDGHTIDCRRVKYRVKLPLVVPSNDPKKDEQNNVALLTTKSSAWKYENESRFIYIGRTKLPRSVSKSVIKRVILGCQMKTEHRDEVCKLVSTQLPDTEIWEAIRSLDEFSLDFRPFRSENPKTEEP